jgi:hypothetical protein
MKKVITMLAVVVMVLASTVVFAAEVTVGGSMYLRSRNFRDLDLNKNAGDGQVDTQERIRLDVNVKAGDVSGKVTIENNWDTMGRFETHQGISTVVTGVTNTSTGAVSTTKVSRLGIREAWMLFRVPNMPFAIKGGHMFLQLGNGWFFRANKYGSDAWIALTEIGSLHLALVDVKVAEGATSQSDDIDAYCIVAKNKFGDHTVSADITMANDRRNGLGFNTPGYQTQAQNLGVHYNGKLGPVGLKAELDVQTGKAKGAVAEVKFKGNQIVIQGDVKLDPVMVNFTVARGSGRKLTDTDIKQMVTFLDADPHYTLLYEYKIRTAAGAINTGFSNTTAIGAGAMFAATKNLKVGGSAWYLMATEKTNVNGGSADSDVGFEVDAKLKWKLYENLNWNWIAGYFKPGDVYKTAAGTNTDASTGVQGVLSMKF